MLDIILNIRIRQSLFRYYTEYPNPNPTISFPILRKVIPNSLSSSCQNFSVSRQSLFPILRKVMKMKHFHFHFNVNVHRTISNLSLSCLCIQRKEFSIGNVNANVYVNLFLFHLRSEVLIIEGYYTKYPNPTPTISFPHFKESYETFSFSCWILY